MIRPFISVQAKEARPSKCTNIAMRVLFVFLCMLSYCEAGPQNDLLLIVWVLQLYVVLLYLYEIRLRHSYVVWLNQPVDTAISSYSMTHIHSLYSTESRALASSAQSSLLANIDSISLSYNGPYSPENVHNKDDEHGRAGLFADPQQYPYGIQARRLEGSPNPESLVVSGKNLHLSMKDISIRQCDNDFSVDDTAEISVSELGIGIPQEDSDIMSFSVNVERSLSVYNFAVPLPDCQV